MRACSSSSTRGVVDCLEWRRRSLKWTFGGLVRLLALVVKPADSGVGDDGPPSFITDQESQRTGCPKQPRDSTASASKKKKKKERKKKKRQTYHKEATASAGQRCAALSLTPGCCWPCLIGFPRACDARRCGSRRLCSAFSTGVQRSSWL